MSERLTSIDSVWPEIQTEIGTLAGVVHSQAEVFHSSITESLGIAGLSDVQKSMWEAYGTTVSRWFETSKVDIASRESETLAYGANQLRKVLRITHGLDSVSEVLFVALDKARAAETAQISGYKIGQTE